MSKKLQDLTIKDDFMFSAVMSDEDNCKGLLELILGISIDEIQIDPEYSISYHPKFKSIRLDVYARDEHNTHYDVEMQVIDKRNLPKRSRYYHSHMDMRLLSKGAEYENLPKAYVIFICDFDPFEDEKYCYSFLMQCPETGKLLGDESCTIFLSTKGKNKDEFPESLICFLDYVAADLEKSKEDFNDAYVWQIQNSVATIKKDRAMEVLYMKLELVLREKKKETIQDNIISFLNSLLGPVPDHVQECIRAEVSLNRLEEYIPIAAKVSSYADFLEKIGK